jgi:hypothetical protein
MDRLQAIAALQGKISGHFRGLLEVAMARLDPKRVPIFFSWDAIREPKFRGIHIA